MPAYSDIFTKRKITSINNPVPSGATYEAVNFRMLLPSKGHTGKFCVVCYNRCAASRLST